jgi:site-specific DNA recombinase
MKIVAYVRVSTDEQELGVEAQVRAVEAWRQQHGYEDIRYYRDIGISGATPADERPGFLAALSVLEDGDILVVAKRDRLARDVVVTTVMERLVTSKGGTTESVDGCGNGNGPEAELMRTIVSAFAQYERALIRTRVKAALAVKKANGEVVGAVPYGYTVDRTGKLHEHPAEQRTICWARDLHARGQSLRAITRILANEGMVSRNGRPFHPQQIKAMLEGDER